MRVGEWCLAAFALLLASLVVAAPAQAAQCMQGKFQRVDAVKLKDRGKTFDVLVAEEDVDAFAALGLIKSACANELTTPAGQAAERDAICRMTYSGNEAVQAQIKRAMGVHPGLLCQSAEKVAGPWPGEKIGWHDGIPPWIEDVR